MPGKSQQALPGTSSASQHTRDHFIPDRRVVTSGLGGERTEFWATKRRFCPQESEGVDKDGDQEHRRHREVLQRQDHRGVRHRGLGRGAHRPEDPAPERAQGGHRRDGPSPEEAVRPFPHPGGLRPLRCGVSARVLASVTDPVDEGPSFRGPSLFLGTDAAHERDF